jgi:hypothetical protein
MDKNDITKIKILILVDITTVIINLRVIFCFKCLMVSDASHAVYLMLSHEVLTPANKFSAYYKHTHHY